MPLSGQFVPHIYRRLLILVIHMSINVSSDGCGVRLSNGVPEAVVQRALISLHGQTSSACYGTISAAVSV